MVADTLLLGHNGYLGSFLSKRINCDLLSSREVVNNGRTYKHIINCIGIPDLDFCERNKLKSEYANRDIISHIKSLYPSAKIINFSSYYVYNDIGECSEESSVTKEYNYCKHKLESEDLNKNGINFRVGKLFGGIKSGYKKLTDHIIFDNYISVDNVSFNPTSLEQVLAAITYAIGDKEMVGTFNLSNANSSTHFIYANTIKSLLRSNKTIELSASNFHKFNNYGRFLMSCRKIKKLINLSTWESDMVSFLKANNLIKC